MILTRGLHPWNDRFCNPEEWWLGTSQTGAPLLSRPSMPPTGHACIMADSQMPEKLGVGTHVSVLSAMCMCACCGTAKDEQG